MNIISVFLNDFFFLFFRVCYEFSRIFTLNLPFLCLCTLLVSIIYILSCQYFVAAGLNVVLAWLWPFIISLAFDCPTQFVLINTDLFPNRNKNSRIFRNLSTSAEEAKKCCEVSWKRTLQDLNHQGEGFNSWQE